MCGNRSFYTIAEVCARYTLCPYHYADFSWSGKVGRQGEQGIIQVWQGKGSIWNSMFVQEASSGSFGNFTRVLQMLVTRDVNGVASQFVQVYRPLFYDVRYFYRCVFLYE